MKALIQRVKNAKVTVNDEVISSIEQGACILIGICSSDTIKDMEYIVRKILSIRIFDDENHKRWQKSIVDKQFEILCVSQFTLYNTWKGNKPDFHKAMAADRSKEFYEQFIQMLNDKYKPDKVKDGLFGAYMQVSIQNDGPVTLEIESPAQIQNKTFNSRTDAIERKDEVFNRKAKQKQNMESLNSTSPNVCVLNVCEESIREKKKATSLICWCSAFIKLFNKIKSKGNDIADDSLETIQLRVIK